MTFLHVIILAIVQGLAELLPVIELRARGRR